MEFDENEWIARIIKESGMSKQEIEKLINEKLEEFGGMVSREGAIIIVGKELGVDLIKTKPKKLKVKNIVPGLTRVNFIGKIVKTFPIRNFSYEAKGERKNGAVANLLVGDETGTIRVSLWNDKAKLAEKLEEGDVVEIIDGYAREDEFVGVEVRIGQRGDVKKIEDVDLDVKENVDFPMERRYVKRRLDELKENETVTVRASITNIFERQMLHHLCPSCREKLDSNMKCSTHGEVEPDKLLVLSGVLDDGYGTINFVAFRDVVSELLKMKPEAVEEKIKSLGEKRFMDEHAGKIVGRELLFKGIVRRNSITGALELSLTHVSEVDVEKTLERLVAEIA